MPVRILFVINPFLGWRTYGRQLTRVLQGRGDIAVDVLTLRIPAWQRLFLKRNERGGVANALRVVDPVTAYRGPLGRSVREAVSRVRPEVVYFGPHLPAASAMELPPEIRVAAVLDCTRHNLNRLLGREVWTPRDLEREAALLRSVDRLFAMSHWASDSLVEDCGVGRDRIGLIPPSIDLSGFGAPSPSSGPPKVLFIGNDFLRKGGNRLRRWVTGPLAGTCELHIVSEDPAARVEGPGIVHHGRVDHARLVGELMPAMDFLCLPTRSDMSPHVLAEAAAAGLPTVASDLGGIPDLVEHGVTGFLVPPDDEQGFVERLRELIHAPDLRRRMSEQGLMKAREEFDASVNYNRLIDDLVALAG